MMELASKKNVKVISLTIAAVFIVGMFALGLTQSGLGGASSPQMESGIGFVNYQELMQNAPGIAELQNSMRSEIEASQKEFNEKSAKMSDQEKAKLMAEYQKKLTAKEKELLVPINKKVETAIQNASKRKGMAVIVDKGVVLYGGMDMTSDVSMELRKQ